MQRSMLVLLIASLSLSVAFAETPAEPAPDLPRAKQPGDRVSQAQFAKLIEQLGHDEYALREKASKLLASYGISSKDALLRGLKHSDAEIRRRCRLLLRDVLELDFERRVQRFKEDANQTRHHDLPGWKDFQQRVGKDEEARQLYLQMLKSEAGLLAAAQASSSAAEEALRMRFFKTYNEIRGDNGTRKMPPTGTVAALMFVCNDSKLKLPDKLKGYTYWSTVIFGSGEFPQILRKGDKQNNAARKLVAEWIKLPSKSSLLMQKFRYAVQYGFKEGLDLAIDALDNRPDLTDSYRGYALVAVGQIGGKQYARKFLDYLDDRGVCSARFSNNERIDIQIRDVALAWLIHFTGQSHAEYGQPSAKSMFDRLERSTMSYSVHPSYFYFNSSQARDAAFEKWNQWIQKNPLPGETKPIKNAKADEVLAPFAALNALAFQNGTKENDTKKENADKKEKADENKQDKAEEDEEPQRPPDPLEIDRDQGQMITEATLRLNDERFTEAARILGRLLESEIPGSIQPDESVRVYRNLILQANLMLKRGPEQLREAYARLFAAKAKALLEKGDISSLQKAAEIYAHTYAGMQAAYRLGLIEQNRGNDLRAIWHWTRLQAQVDTSQVFEPALSVRIALTHLKLGQESDAKLVLQKLRERRADAVIEVGGVEHDAFEKEQLERLKALVSPVNAASQTDWLVLRGHATRNRSTALSNPDLDGELLIPTTSDPDLSRRIVELSKQNRDAKRIIIPSSTPIVVGDTIVFRTPTELKAIDKNTGTTRWHVEFDDTLRDLINDSNSTEEMKKHTAFVNKALQARLWRDQTFGNISSDGERIYCITGLSFGPGTDVIRNEVTRQGELRLDPAWLKRYNVISAFDLKTGKLVWEIGGSKSSGLPFPGAIFRGAPLPFDGRLYAVATFSGKTRLHELSTSDGHQLRESRLTLPGKTVTLSMTTFMPFLSMQAGAYRTGISPSTDKGIVVCPVSNGRWVGIDLLTMKPRWYFDVTRSNMSGGKAAYGYWERRINDHNKRDPGRYWVDSLATISDGHVIVQSGANSKIACLDLFDGDLKWSITRGSDSYIGGVVDGIVISVGRDGVRGLKLADGEPAWESELVRHPIDALPSGRGVLSGDQFFVPLSNGEVEAIDVHDGHVISRSRTSREFVPGNLVPVDGEWLSASAQGLWRLKPLRQRIQLAKTRLKQQPNDRETLRLLGIAMLSNGQYKEAIAHLKSAEAIESSESDRSLLLSAMIESAGGELNADLPANIANADLLNKIEEQVSDRNQQVRLLIELATIYERANQKINVFKTLLRISKVSPDVSKLEAVTAARSAQQEMRLQAWLKKLWSDEDEEVRKQIEKQINVLSVVSEPEEFLALFGQHPSATEVRLEWAKRLAEIKNYGAAESQYRHVYINGSESQRSKAIAGLTDLSLKTQKKVSSAELYMHVRSKLTETIVADGKTGKQLIADNVTDLHKLTTSVNGVTWPEMVTSSSTSQSRSVSTMYPIAVRHDNAPFQSRFDYFVDSSARTLTAFDTLGNQQFKLSLPQPSGSRRYYGNMHANCSVITRGHLMVMWLANRICAYDTHDDKPKLLWTRDTQVKNNLFPQFVQQFGASRSPQRPNGRPASRASFVHLTVNGVCYQQDKNLICLDPFSGNVKWKRDDFPRNSDLIGDDEFLVVTLKEEDTDSARGYFISMLDGRIIRRQPFPIMSQRVASIGRELITWAEDKEGFNTLQRINLWTEEVAWEKTLPAGTNLWMINRDVIGLLDQAGRFLVFDTNGEKKLETNLELKHPTRQLVVKKYSSQYMLLINQDVESTKDETTVPLAGTVQAHGQLFSLTLTGEQQWTTDIRDQSFQLTQPRHVPILTFHSQYQYQVSDGRVRRSGFRLKCIDKRTGKQLHEESSNFYTNSIEITAIPELKRVDLKTRNKTIRFTFSNNDS